jgi:truncated hemoglobin YjbI
MTRATLYEKLGGRDAVNAAVDTFYVKVNVVAGLLLRL